MRETSRRLAMWILLLTPVALPGCLLAAGGAAAGSGVYLTTRGAEAVVHGDLDAITDATRQAFETLGVEWKGEKIQEAGEEKELYGSTSDGEVTVELAMRTENATEVSVRVRKSAVTWDKEMARRILEEVKEIREG
jgi:hypothetical protein